MYTYINILVLYILFLNIHTRTSKNQFCVDLDTNTNKKQGVEKTELIQDEIVEDWYFSQVFCMKINFGETSS